MQVLYLEVSVTVFNRTYSLAKLTLGCSLTAQSYACLLRSVSQAALVKDDALDISIFP